MPVQADATSPLPALQPSMPAEAAEASATLPLPALRRHLLQVASPAGPAALGGATPLARATRRLIVTPWFAAATGIVVAAGLWIYSPHAELTFPNGAVGAVPCKTPDCGIGSQNGRGTPASAGMLPLTQSVKRAGGSSAGRAAARRLKFGYRVLWQSQGQFSMLITVSGKRIPRSWRLAFAMPGDDITDVLGAGWQRSGSYGVTVIWPPADSSWQSSGQTGAGGDQYGAGTSGEPGARFVVVGSGAPVAPTGCSFNGVSCKFSWLNLG
jgi:hypothetical protein